MELIAVAVALIVLLYLAGRSPRKRRGDVIKGWAKVTDGDGVRVKGYAVRLAGLRVQVRVEGYDRYGRVIGTVSCRGRDVDEWLVRCGHAISCFDSRYKAAEREAIREKQGMRGYDQAFDPRDWRRGRR